MPASPPPPLPLLKRIPPGLWTALVWCTAAVQPVIEYVVLPPRHEYSLSYPRDGLDSPAALLLLALAFLLVLAGCALLRHRTTSGYGLVLAGTVVSTVAWQQNEVPPLQFLGADLALCHVAATRTRRTAILAASAALGVLTGYLLLRSATGSESGTASEPFVALTVVIAWLVGNSVHQARAHTAELHARAAAEAVTAERLRIAREMHDTVAHSIGIIALQAGAAARVMETQPAKARAAILTVEQVGRETLAGLRRMLGALRQADEADREDEKRGAAHRDPEPDGPRRRAPAPLRPAVGLADLERLAATTTAAGVRVEVSREGTPRPLPADLDLAAFRIVQEAVTNVVRHANADCCRVRVDYGEDELVVDVVDRGRGGGTYEKGATNMKRAAEAGTGNTGAGLGLVGMRERVALLNGRFSAGSCPEGGFRVTARLPVPTAPRARAGNGAGAGAATRTGAR
ncbi:sensor histidine kinase [Streptomyces sp. NA04227]|uniref:sensor histidine kinase n=1 Tax=Streptomyces sp. NA04227 TaxID=2742136 RepID=UPI0015908D8A|nr:sensor histidine kinase [Streptomyces sp. NA04227]QKW10003.1 sensor histidine kinase [Streptomyces sp. NA04227]